jgi:8-oxo-dGTP diphosphatase|tara:strand:+ start:2649 stop:3095 length:447 start_codon:yes stop_codon:yes gene_type:complete
VNNNVHGAINQEELGYAADYLFRVSIKGLIRNENGEVLVVKETGRTGWDIPGGGMDHGEDFKQAIARELYEEVKLTGGFTYRVIAAEDPALLRRAKIWQIRLIFEVTPENMTFEPGEHGDEVMFINPEQLKDSDDFAERKVYEYSLLA